MNDLFYIFYEPKLMFTDTADMSGPAERAHRRLCDYIWFNDGPPLNQNETLRQLSHTEAADWGRVKRELMQKGWLERDPYFLHRGAIESLNESKKSYVANFNRQAAMNKMKKLVLSPPDPVTGIVTYRVTVDVTPTVTDTQSESESESSQKDQERAGAKIEGSASPPGSGPQPPEAKPKPPAEPDFPEANTPSWAEVREFARLDGIPEAVARAFFDHNEGNSLWRNRHGQLVKVRVKLSGWAARDREEQRKGAGRYAPGKPGQAGAATPDKPSVWALTQAKEAKEAQAKTLFDRYASEAALGTNWSDKGRQSEWRVLKQEIRELQAKIAKSAG